MQVPPWIPKSFFAYSGGFAPPSISKICTLHRYEIENLALLKLSLFFYQLSTLAEMLNSRLTYSACIPFLLVNDLLPVSIWGLSKITILQHTMVWMWPECESALFFPYHCLIQEHHIIMHVQRPVPHTCTHHAHALVISYDDLPLLFLLFANRAASKM